MAAGLIWDIAFNKTQDTSTSVSNCKRSRFRRSNCKECIEICPENAITMNPLPTINSWCSDCGICEGICPTEVFHNELYTDQYILDQAKSILTIGPHSSEKKKLLIHCKQSEMQNKDSVCLTCLGRINVNIILGTAILGFDEIVMISGVCSLCRLKDGKKLLTNAITISEILLKSMGLVEFSIDLKEKEIKRKEDLSRREILSKISQKVKSKSSAFIYQGQKVIREKVRSALKDKYNGESFSNRNFLVELLKQKACVNDVIVKYKPEFPWGKIIIDEGKCSACGICISLCPMKAITKETINEDQILYFNSSLCTNCSLCNDACPESAIDFEEDINIADIFRDKYKVVAKIRQTSCIACGELITKKRDKLCHTCQKRGVWSVNFK